MAEEYTHKDGGMASPLIQPAFSTQLLDSEKASTGYEVLSIRLNRKERAQLNELKRLLHQHQDAKVFKAGLLALRNVIRYGLGDDLMRYLTDERRVKLLQEEPKSP